MPDVVFIPKLILNVFTDSRRYSHRPIMNVNGILIWLIPDVHRISIEISHDNRVLFSNILFLTPQLS